MEKTCKYCKYCGNTPAFCGFYRGEPLWGELKGGTCSRFPEHVRVTDNHFCGEWNWNGELNEEDM